MSHLLFWTVIAIIILDWLWELFLGYLNRKASHEPIPPELSGIYDHWRYWKQQAYSRANSRIGVLEGFLGMLLSVLVFSLGGFAFLDRMVRSLTDVPAIESLLFLGILLLAVQILSLPFDAYRTFVIEQRFGFNKSTPKVFMGDFLKSLILSLLLSLLLLWLVYEAYILIPKWFFLAAWAAVMLLNIFIQMFFSDLIVPLFNKQEPLEDCPLRDLIERFSRKVGFSLKDIYVMDSSRRSTKANAYFTGLGKKRRIVLYDTLRTQLSDEEITAVLAHEIGHFKKRHILKGVIESALSMLLMFWIFSLVIDSDAMSQAAGLESASFHVNLIIFGLLYTPLATLTGFLSNHLSRRNERQADAFAKDNGMGNAIASALRKLSRENLSNLTPHPVVVWACFSHPTLLERVRFLESASSEVGSSPDGITAAPDAHENRND